MVIFLILSVFCWNTGSIYGNSLKAKNKIAPFYILDVLCIIGKGLKTKDFVSMEKKRIFRYKLAAIFACGFLSATLWGQEVYETSLSERALQLMGDAREIVFVERNLGPAYQWYSMYGEYADYGDEKNPVNPASGYSNDEDKYLYPTGGSRMCKIDLRTRRVTVLMEDPEGGFRDPRVHYDGRKILFSYRKGGTHHYHLCEINADGTGFRQLTFGEYDDVDPAYLPDGGIVFSSSRCKRFVACNRVPAAIIYRMNADGNDVLRLSANSITEDRPAVLPDGRIVYTRWDYLDRDPEGFRDLWTMNPDGTGQMVLYGGSPRPYPRFYAECDALPIPGSDKIVSVFSPAFGRRENAGNVMIVDLKQGPDAEYAAKQISPDVPQLGWDIGTGQGQWGFRDPYPLSLNCFLVASDKSLMILDGQGNVEEFYRAGKMVHDPRVIRSRPREPIIPSRIDRQKATGQLVLTDVYQGRNMEGVKRGDIKKLLILEDLPKNGSKHGWRGEHGGFITLRSVLGEVPVESDGSAYFEVPALRALYFVAVDEKGVAVKRMQNFTMVMPGETQGCVGCHEPRTRTPDSNIRQTVLQALGRSPSQIKPFPGVPEVFDYPRDIQPIWDRHCVSCHNVEKPAGRVALTGDNNEWYTQSYSVLRTYDQISRCVSWGEVGNHPPYGFGTGDSPLMHKIDGGHHDVKLTQQEYDMVRLWIESGGIFTGTYAVYNHPENAVATPQVVTKVTLGNPVQPIVEKRCLTCHGSVENLGRRGSFLSDPGDESVRRPPHALNCPRYCWSLYNLSRPEKSMILLASLSKDDGGYEWCKTKDGSPAATFKDTNDPDYQAILQAIQAAKGRFEKYGRPDLPGFRPGDYYIRWMKRFGILAESFDVTKDSINVYETDAAYWRSFWYHPPTEKNVLKY